MSADEEAARAEEVLFSPEQDRRIFEGYLGDRDAMFSDFARDGIAAALVSKRAEALGISASFLARCEAGGVDVAVRRCLSCDHQFVSYGRQNRMCRKCRARSR